MGAPLLANPQLGTFYPPNWLTTPFSAPDAIRIGILLHIVWAACGAYLLARKSLNLDPLPALASAGLFAFGGYVGAHVEQINQLQGLAWMPWLFLAYHLALHGDTRSKTAQYTLLLSAGLALQVFTGHTQTVFITLVGLGFYGVIVGIGGRGVSLRARLLSLLRAMLMLIIAGGLAALLATPQIIPAQELTSVSNRRGGLNPQQAMAFSFSPLVLGRGLLPSYDGQLFGEYIAYPGVIALGLALLAIFTARPRAIPSRQPSAVSYQPIAISRQPFLWLLLALIGLLLALGVYNPLYWTLAALPGFNLFRVPARWMALFGLAAALLAGMGVQRLLDEDDPPRWRSAIMVVIVLGALMGVSVLITRAPAEDISGAALPTVRTVIGWLSALGVLVALVAAKRAPIVQNHPRLYESLLLFLPLMELFLAAQILPYNNVTPPDVYTDQQFTSRQLQVYATRENPPGRILSIGKLLFDPGDKEPLEALYRRAGMDDLSIRLALVGVKRQMMVFPNLPLTWGIPSIDGFDGGLLPTEYYTAFTSLLIPPGELRTIDGRLGEIMAHQDCRGVCLPDQRLLNLTNTRYLITDKVYDVAQNGIFYDTTFTVTLKPGESYTLTDVPAFEASGLNLLYLAGDFAPSLDVIFTDAQGDHALTAMGGSAIPNDNLQMAQFKGDQPRTPISITLRAKGAITIRAFTLVDARTGDFLQLTPNGWRRGLSSDIKLYENQTALPRAFVVYDALSVLDNDLGTEDALNLMRDAAFDPAQDILISGDLDTGVTKSDRLIPAEVHDPPDNAAITRYQAERVEIQVDAQKSGYLLLTDAYYPGWTAAVNGETAALRRADAMFRAVRVPAGKSRVVFEYRPAWLPTVLVIGAVTWLMMLGALIILWRRRHP
jgi:hypothetical protein